MSVLSLKKILKKLKNKRYRDAYAVEHVQTSLPFQIRALREQRDWTQGKLAEQAGTTQTAISRIEDPNYGKLSLNTLYKLASAFDVALLVKFVPFSRLLDEFKDASVEALAAKSFEKELPELEEASLLPPNPWAKISPQDIKITYFTLSPKADEITDQVDVFRARANTQMEDPAIPPQFGIQDITTGYPM